MATRRPARRRSSHATPPAPPIQPAHGAGGIMWTGAVIFVLGLALVALGGWGLVRGGGRGSLALGFGTSIVVGALLIVFAALLPWLADGPVRIGPLSVTLRIRDRSKSRSRRRRRRR